MSGTLLSLSPVPPPAIIETRRNNIFPVFFDSILDPARILVSRRSLILTISTTSPLVMSSSAAALAEAAAAPPASSNSFLSSIANTKSWFQYYGNGFAIRVPPNFEDIMEPEAKDIADLGSLKEATKIFVPGGATLYSARNIKVKEEEGYRNYYYYEFGRDEQHVALVAAVNSGKAIVAGASAPQNKWEHDGVQLRSAAVSLTVL
ncbi:uncharacterized protein LOC127244578 isoform X2 [Andrographis paniculata]|uniref:uncharacterized protein LOC127244578 isoform X2 n=1 Tax=Andrographis paniculata TaxID=175694 RepID=UPI0021E8EDAA|nr:uncharacterized protein LOC127244578 isoform X2 [Andrographis paniculata]